MRRLLEVMAMSVTLIVAMFSQAYAYLQTSIHLNIDSFLYVSLYLDKAVLKIELVSKWLFICCPFEYITTSLAP